ncbi:hypothetical protein M6B38_250140 [Iris pallida]|uniref:Uncharacterized protein n=1 Tax=Iris pallida TaxID=29817 RepID=A0AAX6GNX1_IRIPA|nr:hypothetical protein M6B38_355390 [Iris pallida]KAJ6853276.1 hypothetical protein M6B38_250140 [Iris pallida]
MAQQPSLPPNPFFISNFPNRLQPHHLSIQPVLRVLAPN